MDLSWKDIFRRTLKEADDDDLLGRSAQLSYYFFVALFPTLRGLHPNNRARRARITRWLGERQKPEGAILSSVFFQFSEIHFHHSCRSCVADVNPRG
jgi:hypothetical protein